MSKCVPVIALLALGLCGLLLGPAPAAAATNAAHPAPTPLAVVEKVGWGVELDAYYSNVNLYIPLTAEQVPNLGETTEFDIYRYLLARSFVPRFIYLELSANPMPLLGVYLRKNHPDFYRDSTIEDDFNLIESITAGFREPYAFSVFFGNLADFVDPGTGRAGKKNRAYSGYLFTVGDHHIRHNLLIDDRWLEMEWKIKGDRDFDKEKISWSFRVGGRLHEHPEIADAVYLGLRRSNLDYQSSCLAWLKNSSITFLTEFNAESLKFQRQEIILGKKYPLASGKAFALDLGGIWQVEDRIYTGALAQQNDARDNFIFVIRPNIVF